MNNFNELQSFILNDSDWLNKLKPYLKSYRTSPINKDWICLMYNLFDIPKDDMLYKIICQCRGTIVNKKTGEIICAPFIKFWNYGQSYCDPIDWKSAKFRSKIDGWIYKAFKYKDKIYFSSQSVMVTEQEKGALVDIVPGKEKLNDMSDVLSRALKNSGCSSKFEDGSFTCDSEWTKNIPDGSTICFELESPWNVIHTHLADDAKLWLIMMRLPNGDEIEIEEAKEKFNLPFDTPKLNNFSSIDEILEAMKKWKVNKEGEGLVIQDKDFHRIKIKCEDYLKEKFAHSSNDYGDNRLCKYILNNQDDDLIEMNPSIKSRIDAIKNEISLFKEKVIDIENKVSLLKIKYNNIRDFMCSEEVNSSKLSSFYKKLYNVKSEDLIRNYLDSLKNSATPLTSIKDAINKS